MQCFFPERAPFRNAPRRELGTAPAQRGFAHCIRTNLVRKNKNRVSMEASDSDSNSSDDNSSGDEVGDFIDKQERSASPNRSPSPRGRALPAQRLVVTGALLKKGEHKAPYARLCPYTTCYNPTPCAKHKVPCHAHGTMAQNADASTHTRYAFAIAKINRKRSRSAPPSLSEEESEASDRDIHEEAEAEMRAEAGMDRPERTQHKRKVNGIKRVGYLFTVNNYRENEVAAIQDFAREHCKYLVYAHEVGAEGTPHLQGFLILKIKNRLTWIRRLISDAIGNETRMWPLSKRPFGTPQENR